MKKRFLLLLGGLSLLGAVLFAQGRAPIETQAACQYSGATLPDTINLNDTTDSNIRSYYAGVDGKSGNDLLIALKSILKNGQQYYAYDDSSNIWEAYEITDRDWELSPASEITSGTYDPASNTITNYKYHKADNPYVHALYRNRGDASGYVKAWGNHQATGINREHVWPKSRGFDDESTGKYGARGDLHHLMAGDGYVNQTPHNNNPYAFVDKSKSYTESGKKYSYVTGNYSGAALNVSSSQTVFEPQDCDKGDIARACFYMVARYNNLANDGDTIDSANPNLFLDDGTSTDTDASTSSKAVSLGVLRDLLAWHKLDPVDEYEIHRNNILYNSFTKNRNPFIDYPEWVDYIWGTVTLASNNRNITSRSTSPTGSANLSADRINGYRDEEPGEVSLSYITVAGAKTDFQVGDTFSFGGTVTGHYSDGTTADLTAGCSFAGYNLSKKGNQTVIVTHTESGKTVGYSIYVQGDESELLVDTLNRAFTGVTGNSYTSWSDKVGNCATYAGKSAGGNTSIQLNVNDKNPGVVSTASNGTLAKIKVTWNNNTTTGRTVQFYGKNSAYSSEADLFSEDEETTGTLIKAFRYDGENLTETFLVSDDYRFIGFRSLNYALYLSEVELSYDPIEETVEETINSAFTGISGNNYKDVTKTGESTAVYSINAAGSNSSVQLRSDNKNSGIVLTSSGGHVKSIRVAWQSGTAEGRTIDIYGKDTPYESPADLHGENQGDLLGSIGYSSEAPTGEIEIEEGYPFLGIRSRSNALYLSEIVITYESPESTATRYAKEFLNDFTAGCDPEGLASVVKWTEAEDSYDLLSKAAQNHLKAASSTGDSNIARCLARYEYLVGVKGRDNFMGRSQGAYHLPSLEKAPTLLPYLGIASLGTIGFVAVLFILTRKKD